ncbi:MAG: C69 family dipeptidase [Clostridiales Family XIII bacterium]|nr:C69 family dipeptidase [Clostridiales Family XIII bacterium]
MRNEDEKIENNWDYFFSGYRSAAVTISNAKQAITAASNDPMVRAVNGGLVRADLATVILMNAETARSAIELIANVIDAKGAGGREAFTVSDPNEVWYMEILSGHQYAAVKAPDDKMRWTRRCCEYMP